MRMGGSESVLVVVELKKTCPLLGDKGLKRWNHRHDWREREKVVRTVRIGGGRLAYNIRGWELGELWARQCGTWPTLGLVWWWT